MQYKLFAVRVFVTDWQRAIRFYTETLGIPIAYRNDEIGWAQLATGEGQLALERVDPSDSESKGSLVALWVFRLPCQTFLRRTRLLLTVELNSLHRPRSSLGVESWLTFVIPMETLLLFSAAPNSEGDFSPPNRTAQQMRCWVGALRRRRPAVRGSCLRV